MSTTAINVDDPKFAELRTLFETELTPKIESRLREELSQEYSVKYAKDLAAEVEKLTDQAKKEIQKSIESYQKSMAPPTDEEIAKLCGQEYAEFPIKVRLPKDGKVTEQDFMIKEMPQSVEKRFFQMIKKQLVPALKQFQSFEMNFTGGDVSDKVMAVLETIEPCFDIIAETTCIVLDPWQENPEITPEFVSKNISTNRQYGIVLAQMQANRLRDFFSRVSQSSWMMDAIR